MRSTGQRVGRGGRDQRSPARGASMRVRSREVENYQLHPDPPIGQSPPQRTVHAIAAVCARSTSSTSQPARAWAGRHARAPRCRPQRHPARAWQAPRRPHDTVGVLDSNAAPLQRLRVALRGRRRHGRRVDGARLHGRGSDHQRHGCRRRRH